MQHKTVGSEALKPLSNTDLAGVQGGRPQDDVIWQLIRARAYATTPDQRARLTDAIRARDRLLRSLPLV